MFGKLENGQLIPAPNPVSVGGRQIFNPSAAVYAAQGYLPVVLTAEPVGDTGWIGCFAEENGRLVQQWTPSQTVPLYRLAEILMGEDETWS